MILILLALQGFLKLGVVESGSVCETLVVLQGHRISRLLKQKACTNDTSVESYLWEMWS